MTMDPHDRELEQDVSREALRAYVKRWAETGRLLDELRWRELAALDDVRALEASDMLIESARLVPLPSDRHRSSGLVEQQALFRRLVNA